MAALRAFSPVSGIRCSSCHFALLNAFTSLAGVSVRPALKPSATKLSPGHIAQRRTFKASSSWRSEHAQQNDQHSILEESQETLEDEQSREKESNPEPESVVPWYLQVDPPQRPFKPLSERQRLPELPTNPPPLLQPMLEYISLDLGLDDLLIFDLRKIDPPPALGTNLLMVLGTARSEKHLHVSADRFCRWLRTTHKLSPFADGLLGRGELKLKLRRKARRARLLSSVGSAETSTADDGLRSGWVCVNVGMIDDGGATVEEITEPEGFVGFGGQVAGAKVVIQMLTEEKREELELEELWRGMLARQERREARRLASQDEGLLDEDSQHGEDSFLNHEAQKDKQGVLNEEVGRTSAFLKNLQSDVSSFTTTSPTKLSTSHSRQTRGFHSHPISFKSELDSLKNIDYEGLDSSGNALRVQTPLETAGPGSLNASPAHFDQPKDQVQELDNTANYISLQALLKHLGNLPREDAVMALGSGIDDYTSTTFLKSFYQAFPLFPDVRHWESLLSLVWYALKLGHEKYGKSDLLRLFDDMQASVIDLPSETYVMVFKMLLTRRGEMSKFKHKFGLSVATIKHALKVLEDMHFRGYNIMTEEIYTELMVAAIFKSYRPLPAVATKRPVNSDASQRLMEVLIQNTPGPGSIFVNVESHIRILRAYADDRRLVIVFDGQTMRSPPKTGNKVYYQRSGSDWVEFWKHWHGIAGSMQRRPKELYLLMFHCVAKAGQQAACMKALREWVPQMRREEPAVDLDADIAEAIMECLQVAEPDAAIEAREGQNESAEWVKLWRRCELQLNPL